MIEVERKFLVHSDKLPSLVYTKRHFIEAGYFTKDNVAIRVTCSSDKSKVCFKGPGGEAREEYEYEIPHADAKSLLKLSPTYLQKIRYFYEGWEIDCIFIERSVWLEDGKVIWMAEWEEHEGKLACPNPLPEWIGKEVTGMPEYYNQALAWKYGKK
jgi:adenylate cyclase